MHDVNNIHFTLYAKDGSIKGSLLTAFLTGFVPVKVGVTLASSSPIVGATSQTLTVSIKPNSTFAATGEVLINFPTYYTGATND